MNSAYSPAALLSSLLLGVGLGVALPGQLRADDAPPVPGKTSREASASTVAVVPASPGGPGALDRTLGDGLTTYLASIRNGAPGDPRQVENFASTGWTGLWAVIETYVSIETPDARTNSALLPMLERLSRDAYYPWPMLQLYSPEFAAFISANPYASTAPTDAPWQPGMPLDDATAQLLLLQRLVVVDRGPTGSDLAVRLVPAATLHYLADPAAPRRVDLLEAWNRRMRRGEEVRPIPELASLVAAVAATCKADGTDRRTTVCELAFLSRWWSQRGLYATRLGECLDSSDPERVLAGLDVQGQVPALIDRNVGLVTRFANRPPIPERAIRNFAFDHSQEHSTTLGKIWATLSPDDGKGRYACLFAMGVYPAANDVRALEAIRANPLEYSDVAATVLRNGDPIVARDGVRFILEHATNGHEEAWRLAADLGLRGFDDLALRDLKTNPARIVQQAAMHYLKTADGPARLQLLPWLNHADAEMRLSAVQSLAGVGSFTEEDLDTAGPALVSVALNDPTPGVRQEALFSLGTWKSENVRPIFAKFLADNPPLGEVHDLEAFTQFYWRHRYRLMSLLGLARLGDAVALAEIDAIHASGDLTYCMEVLLCNAELDRVPAYAWDDLNSLEPKFLATAVWLISQKGDDDARQSLKKHFAQQPMWQWFGRAGVDDHNILSYAGLDNGAPSH